jgi:hypothetical protein
VALAVSLANVDVYEGTFAGTSTFGTLVAKALILNSCKAGDAFVPRVPLLVVRSIANGALGYGSYAQWICDFVDTTVTKTLNMSSSGFDRFLAEMFTLKVRCSEGKMFFAFSKYF